MFCHTNSSRAAFPGRSANFDFSFGAQAYVDLASSIIMRKYYRVLNGPPGTGIQQGRNTIFRIHVASDACVLGAVKKIFFQQLVHRANVVQRKNRAACSTLDVIQVLIGTFRLVSLLIEGSPDRSPKDWRWPRSPLRSRRSSLSR